MLEQDHRRRRPGGDHVGQEPHLRRVEQRAVLGAAPPPAVVAGDSVAAGADPNSARPRRRTPPTPRRRDRSSRARRPRRPRPWRRTGGRAGARRPARAGDAAPRGPGRRSSRREGDDEQLDGPRGGRAAGHARSLPSGGRARSRIAPGSGRRRRTGISVSSGRRSDSPPTPRPRPARRGPTGLLALADLISRSSDHRRPGQRLSSTGASAPPLPRGTVDSAIPTEPPAAPAASCEPCDLSRRARCGGSGGRGPPGSRRARRDVAPTRRPFSASHALSRRRWRVRSGATKNPSNGTSISSRQDQTEADDHKAVGTVAAPSSQIGGAPPGRRRRAR